ncbi:MAG: hypothetical protein Udaeo2_06730 [Candidatus Udaeobacter sp.]|nr:MAG: hypothetical protein Udaeo2_06730 [Candidatus Udaeobacter sp.]
MCKYQTLCKGAIVILIWNGFSALAAVYDSDGSSINLQSIHDTLAQNGDTITLPAGMILQQGWPVPSEIIPDDRLAPWQGNVCVPGGIPTRTRRRSALQHHTCANPPSTNNSAPVM